MKIRKAIRITAIILCLSILCSTVANASGDMAELSQKEISSQSISSDSVSAQAKTVGKKYTVWFLFVIVRSEATPFSDSAGILFMREKVTVLSNSRFYSYVKAEDGTTGYVFNGFLSSGMISESNLISGEYYDVYKDATRENLITDVNGNDSVVWTVYPNNIIEFDQETGTVTGLKYGTATITASSGFVTDTCTVNCIYNWEKAWVRKANTSYNSSTKKPDYGYCIVIESDSVDPVNGNKLRAVYMHFNEKPTLQVEDKVKAGDIVGKIGTTGNSTGPHLHLEINNKGTNFAGSKNSDSFDKTINPMFFYLDTELSDGYDSSM